TADAEHRHEAEHHRHQGHTTDVEVDVQGVEDAAQDVLDEDGDEQQPAAHERAQDEHPIFDRNGDHPSLEPSVGTSLDRSTPWTAGPLRVGWTVRWAVYARPSARGGGRRCRLSLLGRRAP